MINHLPQEVQCMIANFMTMSWDLDSLSRTCMTWNVIAIPRLYRCIRLKVPHHANRFDDLENLLSSSGHSLQFTRSLRLLSSDVFQPEDELDQRNEPARISFPDRIWSENLNALVRVLLMKIPRNTLECLNPAAVTLRKFYTSQDDYSPGGDTPTRSELLTRIQAEYGYQTYSVRAFRLFLHNLILTSFVVPLITKLIDEYSWAHNCEVMKETVEILWEYHGRSMDFLKLGPYHLEHKVRSSSNTLLICANSTTLRQLDLGVETSLVKTALRGDLYVDSELGCQVARGLKAHITGALQVSKRPICLPNVDNIKFRGLDLSAIFSDGAHQLINPGAITHLTLESCCELSQALALLGTSPLQKLQSLQIRQENIDPMSIATIETFLGDLPPLTTLSLLFEGNIRSFTIKAILQRHGPSLRTLTVDLKRLDTSVTRGYRTVWKKHYTVDIIKECPNLVELGMPLDWNSMPLGGEDANKVMHYLKTYLPKLRTLNIRNLPETLSPTPVMSADAMVKGLCLTFVEDLVRATIFDRATHHRMGGSGEPTQLDIIALGALEYRDVWDRSLGYDESIKNDVRTLSTYSIDYRRASNKSYGPLLTLIAKGSTGSVIDTYDNISILQQYWLD